MHKTLLGCFLTDLSLQSERRGHESTEGTGPQVEGLPAGWVRQHIMVTATVGLQETGQIIIIISINYFIQLIFFFFFAFLAVSSLIRTIPLYEEAAWRRGSLSSWLTHSDATVAALPSNEMLQHWQLLVNHCLFICVKNVFFPKDASLPKAWW